MGFPELQVGAVARLLDRVAGRGGDLVDAFFERREVVELAAPSERPRAERPGLRVWREEGFAVRVLSAGRTWLASRDGCDRERFNAACRQVSRSPATPAPGPELRLGGWPPPAAVEPLEELIETLETMLREAGVGGQVECRLERHRRFLQVVGERLAPAAQEEDFYSLVVALPGVRFGSLLCDPSTEAVRSLASDLAELSAAREAPSPVAGAASIVVLAPAAAAVFLHEALAHSLEADTLALTGRPEAALGVAIASSAINLLDDPGQAPAAVRRTTDDEGMPVRRRWLLRSGVIEQPLADRRWSDLCSGLEPGAGRRGNRHLPPGPRSYHLDLLAGDDTDLLAEAEGGLYAPLVSRGRLDPLSGTIELELPYARRIVGDGLGERLGGCRLSGRVGQLLGAITGVGSERQIAGAGWCAKSGQKLPVWATTPALRLEGVEVEV